MIVGIRTRIGKSKLRSRGRCNLKRPLRSGGTYAYGKIRPDVENIRCTGSHLEDIANSAAHGRINNEERRSGLNARSIIAEGNRIATE